MEILFHQPFLSLWKQFWWNSFSRLLGLSLFPHDHYLSLYADSIQCYSLLLPVLLSIHLSTKFHTSPLFHFHHFYFVMHLQMQIYSLWYISPTLFSPLSKTSALNLFLLTPSLVPFSPTLFICYFEYTDWFFEGIRLVSVSTIIFLLRLAASISLCFWVPPQLSSCFSLWTYLNIFTYSSPSVSPPSLSSRFAVSYIQLHSPFFCPLSLSTFAEGAIFPTEFLILLRSCCFLLSKYFDSPLCFWFLWFSKLDCQSIYLPQLFYFTFLALLCWFYWLPSNW